MLIYKSNLARSIPKLYIFTSAYPDMSFSDKTIKKTAAITFILVIVVLAFFIIRPILLSIIGALLLAYVFYPVYKRVYSFLGERNTSALAVCLIVILIIFIPIWFILPIVTQQVFDFFKATQTLDVRGIVDALVPTVSEQLRIDITNTLITFIGKLSSASLSAFVNFILDLPTVFLNLAVIAFVFFFTIRDADRLKEYASGLSPLKKEKEKVFVRHFHELTYSIIYGYVIVGIIQGIITGIGLLVFGVPQALLLSVLAIFTSILPMFGAWLVWVPAVIYLFFIGKTGFAIAFAIYGIAIVSTIDNFLRPYIVSKRTQISPVIVFVGMIGGFFVFGILGFVLGPLALAYIVLLLNEYKNKTLSDMFTE